jgi:HD-like signal output (HDOD) protein
MTAADKLASEVKTLYSLPQAVIRLNRLLDDPDSGLDDLAKAILEDPGLTARMLKFVNSAYFGLSHKVDTVSRAIWLIGRRELRTLAMTSAVVQAFRGIPKELIDMEKFWMNSAVCGVVARLLGRRCQLLQGERLFIAGLLHQIGILIFIGRYHEGYRAVIQYGGSDSASVSRLEKQLFGFDHCELGGALLAAWRLGDDLQGLVRDYLHPESADKRQTETCIVNVASRVAHHVASGELLERIFPEGDFAWRSLGLDYKEVDRMLLEAAAQVDDIMRTLMPGAQERARYRRR